jgi:dTMP kinase
MSADATRPSRRYPGVFVTFEGGEGVGKSTQVSLLIERLAAAGHQTLRVREPGSTALGESIRALLLDPSNTVMDARTELLLYEAARAQIVAEVIRPALAAGTVVVCDRFTDSTVAYQGFARGLGCETVEAANRLATDGLMPDRTILLQRDVATGLADACVQGTDRMEAESLDFHRRVYEGFEALVAREGGRRIRVVSGVGTVEEVAQAVYAQLEDLFVADAPSS